MFSSILVAIDPDAGAEATKLLAVAAELRRTFGSALTLATVMPDWSVMLRAQRSPVAVRQFFEIAEARLAALAHSVAGVDEAQCRVESGFVYRGILNAAASVSADLILLSSPAPRWQNGLFGTTASRVARQSSCSVFVIRD
ncbi:universal stress protein [Sphingopyxis sp.]|uniref:universal stress protein n=1 Tax=Sphingopyxis sp. TaxID=1908224 RepID=UPI001D3770D8|nr:universal stress protein [Sphingopyxis sp.]MBW8297813.1 universal stress protein [Sphingopyxis sp.]